MVEKTGDVEIKAKLQPLFFVREIDSRCPNGHRPLAKKDKEDTYWESRDETSKNKAKFQTSSSANQSQTQAPKKDKRSRRRVYRGHPTIGVNATEVAKKDKDKASKDLSHVKCYTCHQKGHHANKCPGKSKN